MAQTVKNVPAMQRPGFDPCLGKILWRRKWRPTPVYMPGEFHGQRSLVGYSPCSCKESDITELLTLSPKINIFSWLLKQIPRSNGILLSLTLCFSLHPWFCAFVLFAFLLFCFCFLTTWKLFLICHLCMWIWFCGSICWFFIDRNLSCWVRDDRKFCLFYSEYISFPLKR